ncbi:MAG: hypothetical protein IJ859_00850 [Synergistaceae bacterium]|nr:hypothetical protein [Synergistaceae bacterium]
MKRVKKFSLLALILLFAVSNSALADDYHYATTDMTWKEFYSGELGGKADNVDAYTSATTIKRFPEVVTNNENLITGLKNIKVRMSEEIYNKNLSNNRFNWSDKAFNEYKDLNEDGTFSAMFTTSKEIKDAKLTLETGAAANWGSYVIKIESVDLSSIVPTENLLGAILETTDGSRYALRPAENYWRKSAAEIALTVDDAYVEIHGTGVVRNYKYFADIVGKTINKITYLIKDADDIILSGFELNLPKVPTVRAEILKNENKNLEVKFEFSNDTGATYTEIAKILQGGGKKAVALNEGADYTYDAEKATLNIKEPQAGLYQVIFRSSNKDIAPSLRAGFYVE